MSSNRLHLGLTPWRAQASLGAAALCQQAELAEQWGYDSFFLPENHFAPAMPIPDPLLLLAAVAARTTRIQLGTSSFLLPLRHPLLAAEQVAAFDQLCDGRLILGLGRGFQPGMLEAFGVAQRDKRDLFASTLQSMIAAWGGALVGDVKYALQLTPRPLQQPHPPLWVAAFGPKAIAQVGELGLPYLASPVETLAELQHNFDQHQQALRTAQQTPPRTVAIMRTVFINEDTALCTQIRQQLAALARPSMGNNSASSGADYSMVGNRSEVGTQLARYQQTLGITHLIAVRPRLAGIEESANRESMQCLAALRD